MNRRNFARIIAEGLVNCVWHEAAILAALERRLPIGGKLAAKLAQPLATGYRRAYPPSATDIVEILLPLKAFQTLFARCQRSGKWPKPVLSQPQMRPAQAFVGLAVPQLATLSDLADWLHLDSRTLARFADQSGLQNRDDEVAPNHYFWHLHPKRCGVRLIEAPKQALKMIQRSILDGILSQVPVHDIAFGFVGGRNCVGSASRHCNEEAVIGFDLKEFFPSVVAPRITAMFRCLGYPPAVARALSDLCTLATPVRVLDRLPAHQRSLYRARHLPQGAPSSPALANLIAYRLDCRLAGLARRLDANVSRYADDITFSGDAAIRRAVLAAVPEIAAEEGFTLNPAKTRVQKQGQRQTVTGLVVNERVNTPRVQFDQLKAILHHCARPDDTRLTDPIFRAQIAGRIGWVAQVNPARGAKLQARLDLALAGIGAAA